MKREQRSKCVEIDIGKAEPRYVPVPRSDDNVTQARWLDAGSTADRWITPSERYRCL